MASILDRDPDADKKMDTRNSIASDFAEDAVVHDFSYCPSFARVFRSLGAMSLTMAVASDLTSIASFAWESSSSICTIIGLFIGWILTNPIIFMVAIATCAAWFFTASIRMDKASLVFITSATLILVSSVCFIIRLPVIQKTRGIPFTSVGTVFRDYTNYSNWDKPVSVRFTFFYAAWVFTGWNAPSAVAEETHDTRIVAPHSIINVHCLQAGIGMLFCILLASVLPTWKQQYLALPSVTGYAAFTLIIERWGLKAAGAFLLIIFLNTSISGAAVLVIISYQTAAFARDRGMLFNDKLSYVLPQRFSPITSETIYSLAIIAVMVPGLWNMGRLSKTVHVLGFFTVVYMSKIECFPPQAD
ncbi:hypothetical protein FVEG_14745 [Fusarium verticillioides 7600]|uniref:Amino acid permease/ SLC12A domain-containing protein n=1 Tax=Gibberella moniliformis (strain M3125 / FGSC 7600) TaxID=334819 RepID=W7LNT3_GIBM7|nr:hypothetical protein FVEG_14745 [Fusarium verticillioides 7600]EWG37089.1 hypothetical protein FVEG_14745 [Fusarium verticillioides 7600]